MAENCSLVVNQQSSTYSFKKYVKYVVYNLFAIFEENERYFDLGVPVYIYILFLCNINCFFLYNIDKAFQSTTIVIYKLKIIKNAHVYHQDIEI